MYYLSPYKNSDVFVRGIEGLIKAGLKGDTSDYCQIIDKNKLSGNEIRELLLNKNKKISGKVFGYEWFISIRNKGECEYKLYGKTHKGRVWVDGDTLCYQFETLYDGMKYCGEVFKNSEGNKNKLCEYSYLTDFWLLPFSVVE